MPNDAFKPDDIAGAVLQGCTDAIIASDAEGIIRFWNPGAARIFGFSSEEAVGQSLDIIIPERLRARHWEGYHKTMRSGRTRYGAGDLLSVPSQHKDGNPLSIEFAIMALKDPQGRMAGIVAVMRDATRRFQEMKTLRQQLRAAGVTAAPSASAGD